MEFLTAGSDRATHDTAGEQKSLRRRKRLWLKLSLPSLVMHQVYKENMRPDREIEKLARNVASYTLKC